MHLRVVCNKVIMTNPAILLDDKLHNLFLPYLTAQLSLYFSPGGDFFTTSGADAIVNVWKSNLNELETEALDESSGLQKMRAKA